MNWYKIVIAGNREDYLRSIGASEDIIQYITSLDENSAQLLTNEFRKNPQLTITDIRQTQLPTQHVTPDLDRQIEEAYIQYQPEIMRSWILKQTRKMWRSLQKSGTYIGYDDYVSFVRGAISFTNRFGQKIAEIRDWVTRSGENIDISSYSYDQAVEASNEWHEFMAAQGEGGAYEPTQKENILYGPTWIDNKTGQEVEEYRGWTIQNVTSENDLIAEGNKCDHCVGGYYDDVKNEYLAIVSLRDPHNGPHVTIELTGEILETVEQIRGKSNSEPKDEYKKMIKHWILNDDKAPQYMGDESSVYADLDRMFSQYSNVPAPDALDDLVHSSGDYGLSNYPWDAYDLERAYDGIMEFINRYERGYGYSGDAGMGEDLAYAAINLMADEYDGVEILTGLIQKTEEKADEHLIDMDIGIPYPQEEDFETGEEYDEAMENYQSIQDDQISDMMPFGFTRALYQSIDEGLQKEKGITLQEWWNKKLQQQKSEQEDSRQHTVTV